MAQAERPRYEKNFRQTPLPAPRRLRRSSLAVASNQTHPYKHGITTQQLLLTPAQGANEPRKPHLLAVVTRQKHLRTCQNPIPFQFTCTTRNVGALNRVGMKFLLGLARASRKHILILACDAVVRKQEEFPNQLLPGLLPLGALTELAAHPYQLTPPISLQNSTTYFWGSSP